MVNSNTKYGPVSWDSVTRKPDDFTPSAHRHDASEIDGVVSGGGEPQDTGTRLISNDNYPDGWVSAMSVRRVGDIVYVNAYRVYGDSATNYTTPFAVIPEGFKPDLPLPTFATAHSMAEINKVFAVMVDGSSGGMSVQYEEGSAAADDFVVTPFCYPTADPFPTTLPGAALEDAL